jgi:hypothetical protein
MAGSAPYEKQYAPASVYRAPIGEAFPDVDTAPTGNWDPICLATEVSEDGIIVGGAVAAAMMRSLGSPAPVKAGVNTRDFSVGFASLDVSPEVVALAMGGDDADVVTAAAGGGHPGTKKIALPNSPTPQGWALLIRWDQSSEGDFSSQLEIKSAVQVGDAGFVFSKSNPNAPKFNFACLYTDANWVTYTVQTSIAS